LFSLFSVESANNLKINSQIVPAKDIWREKSEKSFFDYFSDLFNSSLMWISRSVGLASFFEESKHLKN
jgi:hypothetical protein